MVTMGWPVGQFSTGSWCSYGGSGVGETEVRRGRQRASWQCVWPEWFVLGRLVRPAAPLVNLKSELYLQGNRITSLNETSH